MQYKSLKIGEFSNYAFAELDRIKKEVSKTQRVIDMGIGDPDMPTPQPVIKELQRSCEDPVNHKYPSNKGLSLWPRCSGQGDKC